MGPLTQVAPFFYLENIMGEIRVNLTNFITIGLLAFVFLFIVNRVPFLARMNPN